MSLVAMNRLEAHSGTEQPDMPGKAKCLSSCHRSGCVAYCSLNIPSRLQAGQFPHGNRRLGQRTDQTFVERATVIICKVMGDVCEPTSGQLMAEEWKRLPFIPIGGDRVPRLGVNHLIPELWSRFSVAMMVIGMQVSSFSPANQVSDHGEFSRS